MKTDERHLLLALDKATANGTHIYMYTFVQTLGMNLKRAEFICNKWTDKGWYDYGTSLLGGWLKPLGRLAARRLREDHTLIHLHLEEKCYVVRLTREGQVLECSCYYDYPDASGFDVDGNLIVGCLAKDDQDAIRIAETRYQIILKAGCWGDNHNRVSLQDLARDANPEILFAKLFESSK